MRWHPARLRSKVGHPKGWIAALCLFGLVATAHAGSHRLEGRIVRVADGDTILRQLNRMLSRKLDGAMNKRL